VIPTDDLAAGALAARRRRLWLELLLAIVLPAIIVAGIFLTPFIVDRSQIPFGADTFGYIWRTNLVFDEGIDQLSPEYVASQKSLGERPAHPVVIALLRTLSGESSLQVIWVLPAVAAAAIALAIATLAADVLDERRDIAGLAAVATGASAYVAFTAAGYSANLVFDVLAVAAATLTIRAAFGARRREAIGAGLLVGIGALFHWIFAILFALLLLGYALVLLLGRVGFRKRRARPRADVPLVFAVVFAVAMIVAIGGLLLAPAQPRQMPDVSREGGHEINATAERLPPMALPATIPLATAGAVVIALGRGSPRRRWSLGLLWPWAMMAVVGLFGWYVLDVAALPYRWGGFSIAIPALVVLGIAGIRRLPSGRKLSAIAVGVAFLAAVGFAAIGTHVWFGRDTRYDTSVFRELETVSRYAARLPQDTSIVLPYDVLFNPLSQVRAGVPSELFDRIILVRTRLTKPLPDLGLTGPIAVLYVDSLNVEPLVPGATRLARGVALLKGPSVAVTPAVAPRAPAPAALVGITAGFLGILALAGLGWGMTFTDLRLVGLLGVAPAFGFAGLGLVGYLGSLAGVPLHGEGGIVLIVGTTLAGLFAGGWARLRKPSLPRDPPVAQS
jgi:hypothetical protein